MDAALRRYPGGIVAACADVYRTRPHSLVDVSGRETTLVIDGPRAADLLTLGCPRDLNGIAVSEGRRTHLDGRHGGLVARRRKPLPFGCLAQFRRARSSLA
jgi:heterotetrameric sarcosine oxidase gamma subunit